MTETEADQTDRGIRTFFDDDKLQRVQRISLSLLGAIEESRFAIVVFSPNYATSSYCLDELVHIMSCCKGEEERLVLPVFYDVDPSQVRHQVGAYGEALAKHRRVHGVEEEKIRKWREALYDAANLSGWHVQQGYLCLPRPWIFVPFYLLLFFFFLFFFWV